MRFSSLLLAAVVFGGVASAATTEPERVVNERYHFAFTCEPNSIITFQRGGSGFTCFRQADSSGTGAYALLVFGSAELDVSTEAVKQAGLVGEEGSVGISTQANLDRALLAEFKISGYTHAGSAQVTSGNRKTFEVPYATWSKRARGKTHYALSYVVLHEHKFINVQVESDKPIHPDQVQWLTTKLELLTPPTDTN